jgi:hypothetical protein
MQIDRRKRAALRAALAIAGVAVLLAACAPEVGSERWCQAMRDKPRGDWSTNDALEFARSCVLQ